MSEPARRPLRILLIGGDYARPLHIRVLRKTVADALARVGADPAEWDVVDLALPPPGAARGVRSDAFRREASSASAFVLVTPMCHSSYSGLLKNALDHLDDGHLRGKPVGLMTHSGGVPSAQALDHLRVVVRALQGVAIPREVIATDDDFAPVGDNYEVANPGLFEQIMAFAAELLWFADRGQAEPPPRRPPAAPGGDYPARREPCDRIARAVDYIRANFADSELSLDAVARQACMSRYHFSRTFKAQTGSRFIDFVSDLRLNQARALLSGTRSSVTAICHAVGYRDLSHFERTFKKVLGMSPSEYRAAHRTGRAGGPVAYTGRAEPRQRAAG